MKLLQLVTTAHNGKSNEVYRLCIVYRDGEISGIMWSGIFYVYKPYFLMPGHQWVLI